MAIKARRGDELDLIDRRILSALNEDGRLTINALAEKVGLSPSPCWTRVKRLEESGAIE
jgi:Lrp/AsnC family leucine-responsive transcriptional regulator